MNRQICKCSNNDIVYQHFSEYKIIEDERSFNVYFVKEAGQIWSRKEFCYIEAAAREQPDVNVCQHFLNFIQIYLKVSN